MPLRKIERQRKRQDPIESQRIIRTHGLTFEKAQLLSPLSLPQGGQIRLADLWDIPALCALETLCFPPASYGEHILSTQQFRHLIRKGNALVLVYMQKGQLTGYALLLFKSNSASARLYSIAVSPVHQGAGIGRALLAASEIATIKTGCSKMLLEIRADNISSHQRYVRLGYDLIARMENYFPGGEAALKFECSVDALKARHTDETAH